MSVLLVLWFIARGMVTTLVRIVTDPTFVIGVPVLFSLAKWGAHWAYETDGHRLTRALNTSSDLPNVLTPSVERHEMLEIQSYFNRSDIVDFLVIEGDNKVGKSTIAQVAASRLSESRTVRHIMCDSKEDTQTVLRNLFALDAEPPWQNWVLEEVLGKRGVMARIKIADILSRLKGTTAHPPVFFLKMVELLDLDTLKNLINMAKELADRRAAYFVFVFSPSDKLQAISTFGSFSRAKIVYVGDMTQAETFNFLAAKKCDEPRMHNVFGMIGGNLPHLMLQEVESYCVGDVDDAGFAAAMMRRIQSQAKLAAKALFPGDRTRGMKLLCDLLCDLGGAHPDQEAILRRHKLIRMTLQDQDPILAPRLAQIFVEEACSCQRNDVLQIAAAEGSTSKGVSLAER
jgi:hypothetical protein